MRIKKWIQKLNKRNNSTVLKAHKILSQHHLLVALYTKLSLHWIKQNTVRISRGSEGTKVPNLSIIRNEAGNNILPLQKEPREIQSIPKLIIQNQGVITQKVDNLQYYDIYHKTQYLFKFNLEIFTGVQFGFLMSHSRCPICKWFHPKSYESCLHLRSQSLLLPVPVVLPKLQKVVEQNFVFNVSPQWEVQGCLNQVIVVAKLSFHHVQSEQQLWDWGRK